MKRSWPLWTLLALGLHALPLLWLRDLGGHGALLPAARESEAELAVEVDFGAQGSSAALASEPSAAVAHEPARALARTSPAPAVREGEGSAELEPAVPQPQAGRAAEASPERGLSLDALGIAERNPFLGSELARPPQKRVVEQQTAKQRLERSMADVQIRADHARALGPAGPVLSALVKATRNGETPANSSALFSCVTDAAGKLVSVEVSESDSDPTPWRRIARRALAALASQLLRLPKTGHGAVFRIRVESRQTLPSGADPGLDVSLLGIPLQHGDGDRSGKIEILNPIPKLTLSSVTLPSGQTVDVPTLSMGNILSVAVDPADIGAPAQRVVHARVESMSVAE